MTDFILRNIETYKRYAKPFEQIFGCKLKTLFDNITGFDPVKFDDEVVQALTSSWN